MKTITDDQLTRIIDLLTDMAQDIEDEARARYYTIAPDGVTIHPAQKRRYDRDTASAKKARLLAAELWMQSIEDEAKTHDIPAAA